MGVRKTHQKVDEVICGSMVDVHAQMVVVSYGSMEELASDDEMGVEEKHSSIEVVVMEKEEVETYSSMLEGVGTLTEEEVTYSNKEVVAREMGMGEICRRKEVGEKEMEEVVTCRHREEEVMEMGVVETCRRKEVGVKEKVGVVICKRKEVGGRRRWGW
ncbi:hypothetical protein CMV_018818 [Castanea mollissima]|uniref:Uncharacterized protein n=1 Tax=Castanea mollissima TaxID=60419 RepID=A0A8J4QQV8_9ROSI|nr:hypothetical protein CMV_018818 [Castanea mollissima]